MKKDKNIVNIEDVKKDLKDVRKLIRTMFPDEKLDARK